MFEEMRMAGHPAPVFNASDASVTVTFLSEKTRETALPDEVAKLSMNERQTKALAYIARHKSIRSRDYQELCPDVSPETLRLDLSDLVERGVLLKVGRKRGTYYIMK